MKYFIRYAASYAAWLLREKIIEFCPCNGNVYTWIKKEMDEG